MSQIFFGRINSLNQKNREGLSPSAPVASVSAPFVFHPQLRLNRKAPLCDWKSLIRQVECKENSNLRKNAV